MEEDIRNLKEQKKNNEELRKYMEFENLEDEAVDASYLKKISELFGEFEK